MNRITLIALTLAATVGCDLNDDAGDPGFVQQATETILGRRPKGTPELRVLHEIAQIEGRGAVLELLLTQEEHSKHWTQLIVDQFRVARDGKREQNEACWTESGHSDMELKAIAEHVRTQTPDQDYGTAFTMADLVRGAVLNDTMDSLPHALLFPMAASRNTNSGRSEALLAYDASVLFLDSWTNRNFMCLECHSASDAVVDSRMRNDWWDRHYPYQYDIESTVFNRHDGTNPVVGAFGGPEMEAATYAVFRPDAHATSGGLSPWGMDAACMQNSAMGWDGLNSLTAGATSSSDDWEAWIGGIDGDNAAGLVEFAVALQGGMNGLPSAPAATTLTHAGDAATGATIISNEGCTGCHSATTADDVTGSTGPDFDELIPYRSDARIAYTLVNGNGEMPDICAANTYADEWQCAWDVVAELRNTWPYAGDALTVIDNGDQGLAWLIAQTFVTRVVEQVHGEPLTLIHGYSRNDDQRQALAALTESFIDSGWSLDTLLTEILTSETFNLRTPDLTTHADPNFLPMLANPWAESDPSDTDSVFGADANNSGDLVHRRPVPELLSQVHYALGWPAPRLFPDEDAYPDEELVVALGRFHSESDEGFATVGFQSLWAWEQAVGLCQKPDTVAEGDVAAHSWAVADSDGNLSADEWDDAIDDLLDAVAVDGAVTVGDVVTAIKDRLLQDPELDGADRDIDLGEGTLEFDEVALVEGLFGVPVDTLWVDYILAAADAEDNARMYCGALLKSPQFMLAGWGSVTAEVLPDPALSACLDGELCNAADFCTEYESDLASLGYGFVCFDEVDLAIDVVLADVQPVSSRKSKLIWLVTVQNLDPDRSAPQVTLEFDDGATLLDSVRTNVLSPGGEEYWMVENTIFTSTYGGRPLMGTDLYWTLDVNGEINDPDLSNNLWAERVDQESWRPDYRIEAFELAFDFVSFTTYAEYRVVNRGPEATGVGSLVTVSNGWSMTSQSVEALDAGQWSATTYREALHWPACGVQTYEIMADGGDVIHESNESNNTVEVSVGLPCHFIDGPPGPPGPVPASEDESKEDTWTGILKSVGLDLSWRQEVRPDQISVSWETLQAEARRGDEGIQELVQWVREQQIVPERIVFADQVMVLVHQSKSDANKPRRDDGPIY